MWSVCAKTSRWLESHDLKVGIPSAHQACQALTVLSNRMQYLQKKKKESTLRIDDLCTVSRLSCLQIFFQCDGVRPVCGLCDHGAFRCEWDSKMIMVHTDNHGKGRYKPAAKRVDLGPQAPPMAELSESLNQSALEMHCIDIFWNMYLPKPVTLSFWRPSSIHHEAKWAEYTSHSASQSMTLKCSLSALSAAKVGRDRQDRCLTQKGIELYGKALALLAKELKTPGDVKPFGVLNCCRILALYEVSGLLYRNP